MPARATPATTSAIIIPMSQEYSIREAPELSRHRRKNTDDIFRTLFSQSATMDHLLQEPVAAVLQSRRNGYRTAVRCPAVSSTHYR